MENIDPAAREQGGDDFEGWILRGCADEADVAALDVGQEGVLLGFVETVNLIDEQDGAGMHARSLGGRHHYLLDFLDAAHHCGEFNEGRLGGFGDDFGERGFADAGRTPKNHGACIVVLDLHAEGLAGTEQVFLAAVFGQGAGSHALGQRGHCVELTFRGRVGLQRQAVEEAHRGAPRWDNGPRLWTERCWDAS